MPQAYAQNVLVP